MEDDPLDNGTPPLAVICAETVQEAEPARMVWRKGGPTVTILKGDSPITQRPPTGPIPKVIFEKPPDEIFIKPLYIRVHMDGVPLSRVLVDNGAAVNILPIRKLEEG